MCNSTDARVQNKREKLEKNERNNLPIENES